MKRILSLLLVAFLVVCSVPVSVLSAFALETTTVSMQVTDSAFQYSGDEQADVTTINVFASLADDVRDLTGYTLTVTWDPTRLQFDDIAFTDVFGESDTMLCNTDNVQSGTLKVGAASATAYKPIGDTVDLFSLKMIPLAPGEADISITVDSMSDDSGTVNATGNALTIKFDDRTKQQVFVNVTQNPALNTNPEISGPWTQVGTSKVILIQNPQPQKSAMEATIQYDLAGAMYIDTVSLSLYHCSDVMIGYPEGPATVLGTLDGETYFEIGTFELNKPEMNASSNGTTRTDLKFPAVCVRSIRVLLTVGKNTDVLGEDVMDGKVNWEFIALAGLQVHAVLYENVTNKLPADPAPAGDWDAVGANKVILIQNPNAKASGMTVIAQLDLEKETQLNSIAVGLYHCSNVMIGYPMKDVAVEYSTDGETFVALGTYELQVPEMNANSCGTTASELKLPLINAKSVRVIFQVGKNTDVLGENVMDGKVYWEFIALTQLAVSEHIHTYDADEIVEDAKLGKPGSRTKVCSCGESITEEIPAIDPQPGTAVALPTDAVSLNRAGYLHDACVCILAADGKTIGQLTMLGGQSAQKDMNWFKIIVVDQNGKVIAVNTATGRETEGGVKTSTVCPEGGYIIGYNKDIAGHEVMDTIAVGDTITLYNVDVEAIRGVAGNVAIEGAGFTVTKKPAALLGDLSHNGKLDSADYLLLKRHCLKTLNPPLSEDDLAIADVTGDGRVNASDYFLLRRVLLKTATMPTRPQ